MAIAYFIVSLGQKFGSLKSFRLAKSEVPWFYTRNCLFMSKCAWDRAQYSYKVLQIQQFLKVTEAKICYIDENMKLVKRAQRKNLHTITVENLGQSWSSSGQKKYELQILQTTLDNLVYTSEARLALLYFMGWIYCLVPKLAMKTVCPRFWTVNSILKPDNNSIQIKPNRNQNV